MIYNKSKVYKFKNKMNNVVNERFYENRTKAYAINHPLN